LRFISVSIQSVFFFIAIVVKNQNIAVDSLSTVIALFL